MISKDAIDGLQFNISECNTTKVTDFWNMNWNEKTHDFFKYRIWYTASGSGEFVTATETVTLLPKTCYLIMPSAIVKTTLLKTMQQKYIHFSANSNLLPLFGNTYRTISFDKQEDLSLFLRNFKIIQNNYRNNTLESHFLTQGALQIILSLFMKKYEISPVHDDRLLKILTYINENIDLPLSIQSLAKKYYLNSAYFSDLFKKKFGISPKKYILAKKIEFAQHLLKTTSMQIQEISDRLNFESTAYFTKLFHCKTALTPSEYRSRCETENNR